MLRFLRSQEKSDCSPPDLHVLALLSSFALPRQVVSGQDPKSIRKIFSLMETIDFGYGFHPWLSTTHVTIIQVSNNTLLTFFW